MTASRWVPCGLMEEIKKRAGRFSSAACSQGAGRQRCASAPCKAGQAVQQVPMNSPPGGSGAWSSKLSCSSTNAGPEGCVTHEGYPEGLARAKA